MAGGGSTDQAQVRLTTALKASGADLRGVRALWTSRPNDPDRPAEDNRKIAEENARKFAFDLASKLIREKNPQTAKAPLTKAATPAAKSPVNQKLYPMVRHYIHASNDGVAYLERHQNDEAKHGQHTTPVP